MYSLGGAGRWQFFYHQANELEKEHQRQLPESHLDVEEAQAGFDKLYEIFGPALTLDRLSRTMIIPEKTILFTWNIREYYFKIRMHAWEAFCQREYQRIVDSKSLKK